MYIKEIELTNFRNYEKIKPDFHERINIIIGENAQGKTNLLEGIYLSSFGRSFRAGKDSEMIKFGEKFCKSKVIAVKDGEEISVEIAIGENEKGAKVNGLKVRKTSELLENILVVVFSPDDLKIVKGDPEKRRSYMDKGLSRISLSYYSALSSYRRTLIQRNHLLKERRPAAVDFEVWDEKLAEYGAKLISGRKDFIKKTNSAGGEIHEKITNGKENLEILYDLSVLRNENSTDTYEEATIGEIKEIFLSKLEKNRKNDILKGNTEIGPHRDDLEIRVNGIDMRKFGSQGQQRTAALSMKLAELKLIKDETGEDAVLLLDDVLSELDGERQSFLINYPEKAQLFITATEINPTVMEKLPTGYTFKVTAGSAENVSKGI